MGWNRKHVEVSLKYSSLKEGAQKRLCVVQISTKEKKESLNGYVAKDVWQNKHKQIRVCNCAYITLHTINKQATDAIVLKKYVCIVYRYYRVVSLELSHLTGNKNTSTRQ